MAIYSATKGALAALTTAAAVELTPRNIRVNAIAPGMTRTPLYDAWLARHDNRAETERSVTAAIPIGRRAHPDDIAAAVSFLASGEAAYITGASLPVDGD
jgi:NAD(P)-dependent dehydrogenase (short-subunit alcohol dehydrogenase family)